MGPWIDVELGSSWCFAAAAGQSQYFGHCMLSLIVEVDRWLGCKDEM